MHRLPEAQRPAFAVLFMRAALDLRGAALALYCFYTGER
jgi:hypothetical protein